MHGRGDRAVSADQLERLVPGTGFIEQSGDAAPGTRTPTPDAGLPDSASALGPNC